MSNGRSEEDAQRLKVAIQGAVQGVGFRPFVFRLATEMGLSGFVQNTGSGVALELDGAPIVLRRFLARLRAELPPLASIHSLESSLVDPFGFESFKIRESEAADKTTLVLPDVAPCADCLKEIRSPSNRRFRYPFTNCTNCGPRFSIVEALPYDRPNTSMKSFAMCRQCRAEYENPSDRRFHAQPNACPACGPRLEFWDENGKQLSQGDGALRLAVERVGDGAVLAFKGVGGFHLMVDAGLAQSVQRLRLRKHREEKPFALMFPNLAAVQECCSVCPEEARLLQSTEAPIVLLRRSGKALVADNVAPANPYLGVMLPSSPLHHLFLADFGKPVVATSGNLSDEPICTDEREALTRLEGVADCFLVHNRPIVRHLDDSIAAFVLGRTIVLRRARGFAPLPVHLSGCLPPMLAVGGHLKNTVAVSVGRNVFLSQHIGDLETEPALNAFEEVVSSFQKLYQLQPLAVACDSHPDYASTRFAAKMGRPVIPIQHHRAHVAACMAENEVDPPLLGVSWDGTGYGDDATVWGGEFFIVESSEFRRFAHFRTFPLPGGDAAVREPRRSALGLLHEMGLTSEELRRRLGSEFSPAAMRPLESLLAKKLRSPLTSSVGRLFDAVASLCGLRQVNRFEGQAAMDLEFAIDPGSAETAAYSFSLTRTGPQNPLIVDWEVGLKALLHDRDRGLLASRISAKFHNALIDSIVKVADASGKAKVVLTGGCFQNRRLLEGAVNRLQANGFRVYFHQRVPPGDGGLALGQLALAAQQLDERGAH